MSEQRPSQNTVTRQGAEAADKARLDRRARTMAVRETDTERERNHGSWIWVPSTGDMAWSEGLFAVLGKKAGTDSPSYEALIGAVHVDDKALFLLHLERALQERRALALEHRIVLPDGSVRNVHTELERLPSDSTDEPIERWAGLMRERVNQREATQRFTLLVEAIPDVFWVTSLHFKETLYVSRAYEHLWGRECEELYRDPRAFMDAIVSEDLERCRRDLVCRGTGCAYEVDYRIRHPSGAIRWIHERGYPVRNAAGAVWAMAGTSRDVTCQKNEENELKESEVILRNQLEIQRREQERVQVALDKLPVFIAWHDSAGRLVRMNKLMERELGWSEQELLELDPMLDLFPDSEYRAQVIEYVRNGSASWRDLHLRNRGGASHDYAWSYIPLADGTSIGVGIDLHERRNMERRLRESEAKFRSVYESNAVPFMFWRNRGRITAANDAYLHLIGYSRDDLDAGLIDAASITPDEYQELDQRAVKEQLAGKGVITPYEKELLRKDGSRVPVLVGGALFPDRESGIAFAIDLSERKEAEDALRNLNRELRETLEALRASQSHVIQIEKLSALGTLAGGVAHELSNPMMGVMNYVDYARRVAQEPEVRKVLVAAARELDRMRDLLHNMLAFVRSSDEPVAELTLDQALKKALALMRPELNALQIDVKVETEGLLPLVQAKEAQLQQVLVNLLMNARDALAEASERHIRISARRRDPFVAVDVEDSGPGIPAAIQEQIFDPFFTTKEPGLGTGLGLSISRSIMLESGGDLIFQGTLPGRGTVFTVLVPTVGNGVERGGTPLDK